MGYYNPIYIYGVDDFSSMRRSAGVDGLIVVDLPPEEDEELCLPALKAGLNFIRLATPTTDDKRLPAVLNEHVGLRLLRVDHRHHRRCGARCRARSAPRWRASSATRRCRWRSASASRTAAQAAAIAANADGVVVGSALVDALKQSLDQDSKATQATVTAVTDLVRRWPRACAAPRRAVATETHCGTASSTSCLASAMTARCPACHGHENRTR